MANARINPIDRHIGERVAARRRLIRMSTAEAAARLGVTEAVLGEFESGELRIEPVTLYRLTGVLGVALRYFYEGLSGGQAVERRVLAG